MTLIILIIVLTYYIFVIYEILSSNILDTSKYICKFFFYFFSNKIFVLRNLSYASISSS